MLRTDPFKLLETTLKQQRDELLKIAKESKLEIKNEDFDKNKNEYKIADTDKPGVKKFKEVYNCISRLEKITPQIIQPLVNYLHAPGKFRAFARLVKLGWRGATGKSQINELTHSIYSLSHDITQLKVDLGILSKTDISLTDLSDHFNKDLNLENIESVLSQMRGLLSLDTENFETPAIISQVEERFRQVFSADSKALNPEGSRMQSLQENIDKFEKQLELTIKNRSDYKKNDDGLYIESDIEDSNPLKNNIIALNSIKRLRASLANASQISNYNQENMMQMLLNLQTAVTALSNIKFEGILSAEQKEFQSQIIAMFDTLKPICIQMSDIVTSIENYGINMSDVKSELDRTMEKVFAEDLSYWQFANTEKELQQIAAQRDKFVNLDAKIQANTITTQTPLKDLFIYLNEITLITSYNMQPYINKVIELIDKRFGLSSLKNEIDKLEFEIKDLNFSLKKLTNKEPKDQSAIDEKTKSMEDKATLLADLYSSRNYLLHQTVILRYNPHLPLVTDYYDPKTKTIQNGEAKLAQEPLFDKSSAAYKSALAATQSAIALMTQQNKAALSKRASIQVDEASLEHKDKIGRIRERIGSVVIDDPAKLELKLDDGEEDSKDEIEYTGEPIFHELMSPKRVVKDVTTQEISKKITDTRQTILDIIDKYRDVLDPEILKQFEASKDAKSQLYKELDNDPLLIKTIKSALNTLRLFEKLDTDAQRSLMKLQQSYGWGGARFVWSGRATLNRDFNQATAEFDHLMDHLKQAQSLTSSIASPMMSRLPMMAQLNDSILPLTQLFRNLPPNPFIGDVVNSEIASQLGDTFSQIRGLISPLVVENKQTSALAKLQNWITQNLDEKKINLNPELTQAIRDLNQLLTEQAARGYSIEGAVKIAKLASQITTQLSQVKPEDVENLKNVLAGIVSEMTPSANVINQLSSLIQKNPLELQSNLPDMKSLADQTLQYYRDTLSGEVNKPEFKQQFDKNIIDKYVELQILTRATIQIEKEMGLKKGKLASQFEDMVGLYQKMATQIGIKLPDEAQLQQFLASKDENALKAIKVSNISGTLGLMDPAKIAASTLGIVTLLKCKPAGIPEPPRSAPAARTQTRDSRVQNQNDVGSAANIDHPADEKNPRMR